MYLDHPPTPGIHSIQAHVWFLPSNGTSGQGSLYLLGQETDMTKEGWVNFGQTDLTFTVPAGFDIRTTLLERIEQKKREARADFELRMTELNEQANRLLAIELDPNT